MDASKLQELSKGQKIAGAAGAVAVIATFLPWYTFKADFFDSVSVRGTEFTFGWMGMVLLVAAAAITVAPAFDKEIGNDQINGEQIAIGLAGLGGLMWLFRLVKVPGVFLNTMGRGFGLFVAVAAAVGVIAGIVMTMKEKGIEMPTADSFKSLKDGVSTTASTPQPAPAAAPHPAPQPAAPAPQPVQHHPAHHNRPHQHPNPCNTTPHHNRPHQHPNPCNTTPHHNRPHQHPNPCNTNQHPNQSSTNNRPHRHPRPLRAVPSSSRNVPTAQGNPVPLCCSVLECCDGY